jgi:hypothetical protein
MNRLVLKSLKTLNEGLEREGCLALLIVGKAHGLDLTNASTRSNV